MRAKNNIAVSSLQFVLLDVLGDVLRWPVWWYTTGLIKAGQFCWKHVAGEYYALGLGIWMRNIFVPMFGQYDLEGRIISFFARLIQIIGRAIALLFWAVVMALLFALWVLTPLYVAYQLVDNLHYLLR